MAEMQKQMAAEREKANLEAWKKLLLLLLLLLFMLLLLLLVVVAVVVVVGVVVGGGVFVVVVVHVVVIGGWLVGWLVGLVVWLVGWLFCCFVFLSLVVLLWYTPRNIVKKSLKYGETLNFFMIFLIAETLAKISYLFSARFDPQKFLNSKLFLDLPFRFS